VRGCRLLLEGPRLYDYGGSYVLMGRVKKKSLNLRNQAKGLKASVYGNKRISSSVRSWKRTSGTAEAKKRSVGGGGKKTISIDP